jgi:hypothetical protein
MRIFTNAGYLRMLRCIFGLCMLQVVLSHPDRLPCSTSLTAGTILMGASAISDSSRSVVIFRGASILTSGDTYEAGETLTVGLSSTSDVEYIFEADGGAAFVDGECSNARSPVTQSVQLTMPSEGDVTLKVAWATHHGTVHISNLFTLTSSAITNSSGSSVPSLAPSQATSSTVASDDLRRRKILGIVIGVGTPVIAGIYTPYVVSEHVVGTYSMVASLLTVLVIALVLAWGTDNDVGSAISGIGFLGRPNWATNPFAYHPIMMVVGYYIAVVLSLLSETVFVDSKSVALHGIFYCAAIACFIVGLVAVVKSKHAARTPSLTTLHSWVAIGSIIFAIISLFWRCGRLLSRWIPREMFPLVCRSRMTATNVNVIQRCSELLTLGMITMAILTGITMHVGQCYYVNTAYGTDSNPAANYNAIPDACKMSFGTGIIVIIVTILTSAVFIYKRPWSKRTTPLNPLTPELSPE